MFNTSSRMRAQSNLRESGGLRSTRGRSGALMWPAFFFLALAACGEGTEYECGPVPHLGAVRSEMPILCETFAWNADQAFLMAGYSGLVPSGADHDFERMTVVVQDVDEIRGHDGKVGWYDGPSQTAYLTRDGKALMHEMFHHWEVLHFVLNTGDHPDWAQKGYVSMDDLFQQVAKPIASSSN